MAMKKMKLGGGAEGKIFVRVDGELVAAGEEASRRQRKVGEPAPSFKRELTMSRVSTLNAIVMAVIVLFAIMVGPLEVKAQSNENCYINDSGFTCCSKTLESAMKSAMSGRDLLSSADNIQKMAERTLGGKFETVVAMDDFAHKSHFKEGKTCKIEKNGQYALAWQP